MRTKPGWKTFVQGQTYTVEEFVDQTWGPDHQRMGALPPETLFRYHKPPGEYHGYFEQIVEPENALVSSETAQKAVEELRERGMSYRQIARLGGVSIEAVHRSASGVGRIRRSTQEAIVTVAASADGQAITQAVNGGGGQGSSGSASTMRNGSGSGSGLRFR